MFGYAWGDFASAVKDAKNAEEMRTNLREVMDKYHRTALPNDMQKAVFDYAQASMRIVRQNRYKLRQYRMA